MGRRKVKCREAEGKGESEFTWTRAIIELSVGKQDDTPGPTLMGSGCGEDQFV